MSKTGKEWKVGLFVALCLFLAAGLIMRFSKGASLFTSTFVIKVESENVGGIIPGAGVLMAGVPIGSVVGTEMHASGKTVIISLKILSKYQIYDDATFAIKQAGFLGDRFVSVIPNQNLGKILKDGDVVSAKSPFDIEEMARVAGDLVTRVSSAVEQLSVGVKRLDSTLLSPETLSNITITIRNFRTFSENSLGTIDRLNRLVDSNTPSLNVAVSNFSVFSDELNVVARELQLTLATNRIMFSSAVRNIDSATAHIDNLLKDVESGKGLAGNLIKNEDLSKDMSSTVSNLMILSSNVNSRGLWSVMRKPKAEKENESKRQK